ncbi:MAG: FG-GAP-like repeat-containing protein [Cryomorphaceae bacterium]
MRNLLLSIFAIASGGVYAQSTCDTAEPIEAGIHVVDTVYGELPPEICAGNGTGGGFSDGVWFTYTAAENINVTLNTDLVQNTDQDTRVHIYTGTCGDFSCLAGDDDGGDEFGPYLSLVTFAIEEGETVYIVWDDRWDANGFEFELTESDYIPPPAAPPVTFTPQTVGGGGAMRGIVDLNGDYLDDIVAVSQATGHIYINYQTEQGGLTTVNIENDAATYYPSWSLTAGDLDGNGINDLVFGGGSGVSFMFANDDGTDYTEVSGSEYVFCQRGNAIDINNDGHLDFFMCHDVQPNVYYMNDGEGNLEFNQGGLGDVENGGNYGSIWVDYDMDGDTDLFIAKCRGGNSDAKINEIHRNNGDGTFDEIGEELDLNDPVQTWSSAWGDYDNDGDMDIFIGASSFADGNHKLLENNGDGTFTDVTEGSGVEFITGTGIENITHDFDNDGHLDLLGMGGTFMHGNGDMTFTEADFGPNNGAVGDVNNDGFLDVLNQQIHINDGNDNNYLVVQTQGTTSNFNGIGAMIEVNTPGLSHIRQVRSGDGFRYMSSLNAHFGLGQETEIESVVINWPSGVVDTIVDVDINTSILAVEGSTIVSTDDLDISDNFLVYPNPAKDEIFVDVPFAFSTMKYMVYDMSGRMVDQGIVNKNSINTSKLQSGMYVLSFEVDGKRADKRLVIQ